MSIFARREIQERLNALSCIIGKRKLRHIVDMLNLEGSKSNEKRALESVAATWEVVIVSAFCDTGATKYETRISNGKTPDIFFCDHGISFIGDVFTVSDDQQHKKNPAEEFSQIINKIWREAGPKMGSFSWLINSVDLKPPPAGKPGEWGPLHLSSRLRIISRGSLKRLTLPPSSQLNGYLHAKVRPFFLELSASPHQPNHLTIDEMLDGEIAIQFSISYDPKGKYISGSYPSYTTVTDIDRHVLYRRLKEKSNQFVHASENCPRIIIVCDGGCAPLRDSFSSASDYSVQEIIDHFWKRPEYSDEHGWTWAKECGISAVLVISVESGCSPFQSPLGNDYVLKATLYLNAHCQYPVDEGIAQLLSKIITKLPVTVESPENALRLAVSNPISSRRLGALTMSKNRIEMSAVALLQILAGELSMEEFCRDYSLDINPFKRALRNFQTIKSISADNAGARDDDKIVIEFRDHDAAIGRFKIPVDSAHNSEGTQGRKK